MVLQTTFSSAKPIQNLHKYKYYGAKKTSNFKHLPGHDILLVPDSQKHGRSPVDNQTDMTTEKR